MTDAWQAKEEARRAWMAENSLYRAEDEHSSCGVGLVVSIDGTPSRKVVANGIEALKAVWHRGAVDADGRITPHGAVLAELPLDPALGHALLRAAPWTGPRPAAEATAALALDLRAPGADLEALVAAVRDGRHPEAGRWRREADRLERLARRHAHHAPETRQRLLLSLGQPGQRGELQTRGNEFVVLSRPRHPVAVVAHVDDVHHACSSFLSIAARACRT